MILPPRPMKDDTGLKVKGEFFSVLNRFGLKPVSPNFAFKTDMRRHVFSKRTMLKIAGLAVAATVTWTLTYDSISKGILEAKRETFITDMMTGAEYITATVVFLTTTGGGTAWTKDATWNDSANTVEIIGTGATGAAGSTGKFAQPGTGAGGGAYCVKPNVVLSGNPSYNITATALLPADCWFVSATDVLADSGTRPGAVGQNFRGEGGLAANCIPTTGAFDGGDGVERTDTNATGGGGAAGLHGAGGNSAPSVGGTGDNGNTAAAANGTQYDATHGSGGGGNGPGGAGGLYGAGGGGGAVGGGAGGVGTQGLIVLTWTPAAGANRMFLTF